VATKFVSGHKHITQKLSLYYGKGSSYITKILTDSSDHFAKEYQAAQTESQALAYIKLIYSAGEKLFGAHGMFTQNKFHDGPLDPLAANTRESTLKQFKNGELSYKETPLGGCTQTTPCLKRAFRSVVGCLDCARAIIKPEKLLRTIKIYERKLSGFTVDDVARKMEERDIFLLNHYYENYVKPKI